MAPNIRQKYPAATGRATKRRGSDSSSSLDLSDEDGYSGVDEVSDSEDDDEEDVDAAEEEHIISRVMHKRSGGSPRPKQDEDEGDEEEDEDEDEGVEAVIEDDDVDGEDEEGEETGSWDGILSEIEDGAGSDRPSSRFIFDEDVSGVERRVRFAGVPDSDSDSTTTETTDDIEEFFPDIFVAQSSLDPAFRREIEHDPDESSNSGSFWDFQGTYDQLAGDSDDEVADETVSGEGTPIATPSASQVLSDVSTPIQSSHVVQELDGYETDGDTTEEDIPEPPARKKQARRAQSSDDTSDSEGDRPVRFRRGQPRVGRFHLDSSDKKPIAVVNPISRRMMIFTPQRLRRLDLSPESFNLQFFGHPDGIPSAPILSNSASLMMSAMFSSNTFGDFMNTQAIGPAEAFFSFPSDAITAEDSVESEVDADEDEAECHLQLEDFITFHQESSDEEGDQAETENWDEETGTEVPSTPVRPRTSASDVSMPDVHPLLNHFDNNSDAVGAFRRNQVNQQLILSDKATQESLAFSNGFQQGTLRGIKSGSLETVTTPITPIRRQKRDSMTAVNPFGEMAKSPPETTAQKRKASSGIAEGSMSLHKRHRSISDVELIQI